MFSSQFTNLCKNPIAITQEPALAQPAPVRRLVSLDALRGFDMFWIIGGEEVVHVFAKVTGWGWTTVMADQFTHVKWDGYRHELYSDLLRW